MGALDGRVALITGAARGQGAAAARRFVAEGARVGICDVLREEGEALAAELGAAAWFQPLDVGDEEQWARAAEAAEREAGGLDVLVNNAGVLFFAAIEDTSLADYERLVRINQTGTFLGMRACVPLLKRRGGGSIVNISSVEGIGGMPMLIAYAATKFAIRGMTKVAAMELGGDGIRVNSVHPGMIDTKMISSALGGVEIDVSPGGKRVAAGRVGTPDEVANLVLFLASDQSAYCTGAEFVVDGGATATHALAGSGGGDPRR